METLTVLVVMGILTSFAVVLYGNYHRALRAKSAARQMEVLFSTARALAINQNAHFQAVLDLDTSGMWIDRIATDGTVVAPKITTPDNWSIYVKPIEVAVNGASYQSGLVRIRFHPDGTSDSARIVLMTEGGDSLKRPSIYTIKLYSPTARSRVFPGRRL